ncbi:uncharacterized protein LOC124167960 [Ischnura elegans]|uniref:uncharacterized protein LOC124167960 n=1 Tax=Ischnura elegans TaxID=197161 RepID=UPI001ED891BA|nr:uncharacterized protein LOC124167960 [Ischnura elegans]
MSPRSHILAESENEERWEEMSQVSTSSSEGGERQEAAIQESGSPIAERERAIEASTPESTEEQRYPSTTESQAAARQRSPYLLRPRPTPTPPEPLGVREGTPRRTPASCLPSESSTLREYAPVKAVKKTPVPLLLPFPHPVRQHIPRKAAETAEVTTQMTTSLSLQPIPPALPIF